MLTGNWIYQLDDNMFKEGGGKCDIKVDIQSDPLKNSMASKFGCERFSKRERLQLFVTNEFKNCLKESVLDMILGVASGAPCAIGPVMTLFGVPKERHIMIKSLIHLFNKNNSMLLKATEDCEQYLEQNPEQVEMSPGVIQALYGAIR